MKCGFGVRGFSLRIFNMGEFVEMAARIVLAIEVELAPGLDR
ncbi:MULTISPECIES: hypothetical protein [unclassified Microcoleus]